MQVSTHNRTAKGPVFVPKAAPIHSTMGDVDAAAKVRENKANAAAAKNPIKRIMKAIRRP